VTEPDINNISSRMDRLEVTLSHAVEAIEKTAQVVNKGQETKWGPILTAVSLLFLAASGYTTLITMPINERANLMEAQVAALQAQALEDARALGRVEGVVLGAKDID